MKKALANPMAVSFGQSLYVFAGLSGAKSNQKYDIVWDEWTFKAEMPQDARKAAAVTVGKRESLATRIGILFGHSFRGASASSCRTS